MIDLMTFELAQLVKRVHIVEDVVSISLCIHLSLSCAGQNLPQEIQTGSIL